MKQASTHYLKIGNTRMVLWDGARKWSSFASSQKELPRLIRALPRSCKTLVVMSVVPKLCQKLSKALQSKSIQMLKADPQEMGVKFAYKGVGEDRQWNMVEAFHRSGSACVVVDFGSAICVDLVNGKGEHLGGWITPGRSLMAETLAKNTAQLPQVASLSSRTLGRSTKDCIEVGIFRLMKAILSEAKLQAMQSFKKEFKIFITGGDSRYFTRGKFEPYLGMKSLPRWEKIMKQRKKA